MFFLIFYTYSVFKKHHICLHKDTVATNTMDNVDTENEGGEGLSSQAVCTDTQVTTWISVDKHHVLNVWFCHSACWDLTTCKEQ